MLRFNKTVVFAYFHICTGLMQTRSHPIIARNSTSMKLNLEVSPHARDVDVCCWKLFKGIQISVYQNSQELIMAVRRSIKVVNNKKTQTHKKPDE